MVTAAPPGATPPTGTTPTPGTFTPLKFQNSGSYGWTNNRGAYHDTDVPQGRTDRYNTAYEWFQYRDRVAGGSFTQSNPPFSSGAAGRLVPSIQTVDGAQARILRGFIRRADYDKTDAMSSSRLYFMFNPSIIARDYVSYLDQGALDPFNTVFQSNNLVAPPSMMNFTFELFFDRQDEARLADNPGVLVDMEFFDMVVRNVIPDPDLQSMPDNGVMMVNPRDITVVFSPEITIQGRPLNASVVYEKFTHRMIPTRMRIQLTMRVVYWGPLRDMTTYTAPAAEAAAAVRVGYTSTTASVYNLTYSDLKLKGSGAKVKEIIDTLLGLTQGSSTSTNGSGSGALQYAINKWTENGTIYDKNARNSLWKAADCSSFVWGGFAGAGQATALGWPAGKAEPNIGQGVDIPSVAVMHSGFIGSTAVQKIWGYDGDTDKDAGVQKMAVGDLLIRYMGGSQNDNHIAFVSAISKTSVQCFHAKSHSNGVGYSEYKYPLSNEGDFRYTHGVRPLVQGGQSVVTQDNDQTRP